jgi:hypothetical protein
MCFLLMFVMVKHVRKETKCRPTGKVIVGMGIQVWVTNPTGTGMEMIFYLWVALVSDLN